MARINLLPWREAERERRNKEFTVQLFGIAVLAALLAFMMWSYFNQTLSEQRQANDLIRQENTKLEVAIKEIDQLDQRRQDIISRMKVIQDLQGRRPVPVRVWDDIVNAIPHDMYITEMQRTGETIALTGRAKDPNIVSDLLRNLDAREWLENSKVDSITQPKANAYSGVSTSTASGYPEENFVNFRVTTQISQSNEDEQAKEQGNG